MKTHTLLIAALLLVTSHQVQAVHLGCSFTPSRLGFCETAVYEREYDSYSNVSVAFTQRKGEHYNYGSTGHVVRERSVRQSYKLPTRRQKHCVPSASMLVKKINCFQACSPRGHAAINKRVTAIA
ncbi:hypothetical protein [Zooshikella ganghwensis]|uniref:Uncharacterized protein n=1 Tax=Zooshikella ganghwensis TaxID=202772 RepID=A0A4P9VEL3_9GAMM|nr:hypothetical protein [Zooshikella ganghwensis]RDH41498.1 hypothetical protein B9G39_28185 [Zooshikella ganghwensis]